MRAAALNAMNVSNYERLKIFIYLNKNKYIFMNKVVDQVRKLSSTFNEYSEKGCSTVPIWSCERAEPRPDACRYDVIVLQHK